MRALSNSKFPPCSVGDTVRVKIPDVDQGRGDFSNILITVIEKTDDDFYKLANKRGTIDEMFTRNQFYVSSVIFGTPKFNQAKADRTRFTRVMPETCTISNIFWNLPRFNR
ncbi:hypothetical protein JTB14_032361 [Gonioctena quinquepunctata]|nr:hypothetical protein JTB14_032361 [Gonioctena quinquepunctata]